MYVQNAKVGDTTWTLEKHVLLSGYIWQVNTRSMFVISGHWQLNASGPFWFLQRAGTFQTWTVYVSFRFLRPKARRFEAGACQSSTASCWSRKRDCPCEIPGLIRQHSRMQRHLQVVMIDYLDTDSPAASSLPSSMSSSIGSWYFILLDKPLCSGGRWLEWCAHRKVWETINEAHPWGKRLKYWSHPSVR